MNNKIPGVLLLEDGTEFSGSLIGARTRGFGEVVFNTGMSGYQEILTDPSYWQQLVVMTYPHQGNYGINDSDSESEGGPKVGGFIVHEIESLPSNFESTEDLQTYLERHNVTGLSGVDTRSLTVHIRSRGAMRGLVLSDKERASITDFAAEFAKLPKFEGRDLILEVTTKKPYWYSEKGKKTVVALDFGVKTNLLREIAMRDCKIVVLPANSTKKEILSYHPDGVFLSNGPGDPAVATYAIETVKQLLGETPIFGVCMGHQILGHALGGRTYKMKFGHRGANQPVADLGSGRVEISSHNHGFAVEAGSLPPGVTVTHRNLNDETCEGIECLEKRAFSVQYHPESAPGPHDSSYLFDRFIGMI
ncbi:MAG TPA: glutamine-hydrolyzing carbamoyl-phosphate synthase small subunit [Oligoflexia bacterium]|nr:glutamine-hydrolyzing carbamoyl-phosphate synthase small subunit [Oligoflexia bacterium]